MFIGSKETQQASTQQILEAKVYLERAESALAAITPAFTDGQNRTNIKQLRDILARKSRYLDDLYNKAFAEAYKE